MGNSDGQFSWLGLHGQWLTITRMQCKSENVTALTENLSSSLARPFGSFGTHHQSLFLVDQWGRPPDTGARPPLCPGCVAGDTLECWSLGSI